MRVSCLQTNPQTQIAENIEFIFSQARKAHADGAEVIVFPEMFTYMGEETQRHQTKSSLGDGVFKQVQALASELNVTIIAGSHSEKMLESTQKVSNTCVTVGPSGNLVSVYRKQHLFNLIGPHGEKLYCESDSFIEGAKAQPYVLTHNNEAWKALNIICYDLRFPEAIRSQPHEIDILFVPAAFTWQTGRDHWEILLRARAIENQCYVVACNQTGSFLNGQKRNYGHSMIIDPWGKVVGCLQEEVGILTCDLSFDKLLESRRKLPALKDRKIL